MAPKHCPTSGTGLGNTPGGEGSLRDREWGLATLVVAQVRNPCGAPCLLPPPHPGSGPPLSYFSQRTGEERGFPANPRVEEPINFCPCQDWVSFRARCCQMPWFLRLLPHSVILYFFLSVNFILSFDRCPS